MLYYIKKYKNIDALICDCGESWDTLTKTSYNIATFQLLYALLLPKIGGNFIIKTAAPNIDMQYLSLLYIATMKYKKVYIFKSGRNFWSPEIYIVGKNFIGIKENEQKNLVKIFREAINHNILYPVEEISKSFIDNYYKIINSVINQYRTIRYFFVYLLRNPTQYEVFKQNLKKNADKQNMRWLSENIKHIQDIDKKYKLYINEK